MNKNKRDVLKGLAVGSVWATPVVSSVILPVHAATTGEIIIGADCLQFIGSPQFVDFEGGNYIPSTGDLFTDSACQIRDTFGIVGCRGFAYAPEGIGQANEICQANVGVDAEDQGFLNDVYRCGCDS